MIFRLFLTVVFFGFAILLGILGVMRGLYRSSIIQPPEVPDDFPGRGSFEDSRKPLRPDHDEIGEPRHCQLRSN
jgi:hypothetical protein